MIRAFLRRLSPWLLGGSCIAFATNAPSLSLMTKYYVLFNSGSFKVNADGQAVINLFVNDWGADGKSVKVKLSCQTDRVGSESSNLLLSQKRCDAVHTAIAETASTAGRNYSIVQLPQGELELIVPTADGVAHPANRTVIIYIADYYTN